MYARLYKLHQEIHEYRGQGIETFIKALSTVSPIMGRAGWSSSTLNIYGYSDRDKAIIEDLPMVGEQ